MITKGSRVKVGSGPHAGRTGTLVDADLVEEHIVATIELKDGSRIEVIGARLERMI